MFGKSNNGNGSGDNGDTNGQQEQEQQRPIELPPLRAFIVTRLHHESGLPEEIVVQAHISMEAPSGSLTFYELLVSQWSSDGVLRHVVRSFRDWEEFREEYLRPSVILH